MAKGTKIFKSGGKNYRFVSDGIDHINTEAGRVDLKDIKKEHIDALVKSGSTILEELGADESAQASEIIENSKEIVSLKAIIEQKDKDYTALKESNDQLVIDYKKLGDTYQALADEKGALIQKVTDLEAELTKLKGETK